MVEMGVREEDLLDAKLFGKWDPARHRSGIDQGAVVDEEGRGALPGAFASEGAKHPDIHNSAILA